VNGVLGKMSVSEAEEVVEQLSEGGMISMEQGVIDGTTAEGQKQIEKLEKEAREEKERVEEEEKRRAREEDQAEKAAYAEEDDPSYADALLDHVEQDEGLSFATCLARRKAARRAAEEGKEGEEGKSGEGKIKVADPE